jgi:hypothetical protein
VDKCPTCGAATEIYSRIVGYFRPVSQWNKGKTEEFGKRRAFEPELKEREMVFTGDIWNKGNIADRLPGEDSSGNLHEPMQLSLPILS